MLGFLNIDPLALLMILLVFLGLLVGFVLGIIALVRKSKKLGIVGGVLFVACLSILLFLFGGLIF